VYRATAQCPKTELQLTVGIVVGVVGVLSQKKTRLERMRTHNFGERVTQAGMYLLAYSPDDFPPLRSRLD